MRGSGIGAILKSYRLGKKFQGYGGPTVVVGRGVNQRCLQVRASDLLVLGDKKLGIMSGPAQQLFVTIEAARAGDKEAVHQLKKEETVSWDLDVSEIPNLTPEIVLKVIARHFNVSDISKLKKGYSRNDREELRNARVAVRYFLYKCVPLSLRQVEGFVGIKAQTVWRNVKEIDQKFLVGHLSAMYEELKSAVAEQAPA